MALRFPVGKTRLELLVAVYPSAVARASGSANPLFSEALLNDPKIRLSKPASVVPWNFSKK